MTKEWINTTITDTDTVDGLRLNTLPSNGLTQDDGDVRLYRRFSLYAIPGSCLPGLKCSSLVCVKSRVNTRS